ncbi:hypothetical protein FNF27_00829 [Cafeteria roenbergensis]|uniref:Uncharacterized protein n=1 Tax=Cafeteria roenbergensis TaxID=33653 RepID=A0A5A8DT75_CAFRO|nr:hypothetical protein FNF29_01077 [Cafeteria roenbergensis]KAA0168389.1 hypothetical protein FNF31_00271 [Cafeteria roenbergensis]KAA0177656.1 hypothetical protein FNF27_00829 [Cafeteria roenbergensis]|eukprot:KAA0156284.1 hypothetical protein FNF29_01077 [Cafeteria roenbergensis]
MSAARPVQQADQAGPSPRRPVGAGALPDYDAMVQALREEAAHAWELNSRAEAALVEVHASVERTEAQLLDTRARTEALLPLQARLEAHMAEVTTETLGNARAAHKYHQTWRAVRNAVAAAIGEPEDGASIGPVGDARTSVAAEEPMAIPRWLAATPSASPPTRPDCQCRAR